MAIEYEVKLCASRKTMEKIESCTNIMHWRVERGCKKHLISHYFDTDDFKLLYNNFSYRLREEGGKKFVHLKANGSFKNGIYIREELEIPLRDAEDFCSKEFLRKSFPDVFSIVKDAELKEMLVIDTERHILGLTKKSSLIEGALDFLYFVRGKRKLEYEEIELELKKGKEEDLIECFSILQAQYNLKLAGASKYELGLRSFGLIPLI